jgi:hypothetical protein
MGNPNFFHFVVSHPHCVYSIQNHKICINQSEQNHISNKWYIKYQQYQLHVSASILAIIRLYSSYQVTIQYAWGGDKISFTILGGIKFELYRITKAWYQYPYLTYFHIHAEFTANNHLNDKQTIFPNTIFDTFLKTLQTPESRHTLNFPNTKTLLPHKKIQAITQKTAHTHTHAQPLEKTVIISSACAIGLFFYSLSETSD